LIQEQLKLRCKGRKIYVPDDASISPFFPSIGLSGPIGSQRAHAIINAYLLAFFDRHLKNLSKPLLDRPAKQYPEVLFNTRRP
jgi:hypothetical protein